VNEPPHVDLEGNMSYDMAKEAGLNTSSEIPTIILAILENYLNYLNEFQLTVNYINCS